MDTKKVRLTAEHTASCAVDCATLVEELLGLVDADVESGSRTFDHALLEHAAEGLERVAEELNALKQQLVTLRYSDDVRSALPDEIETVSDHARRLQTALGGLLPRAFVFARAARLANTPPDARAALERGVDVQLTLVERIVRECEAAPSAPSLTLQALSRLLSLHEEISYADAEERESARWRL